MRSDRIIELQNGDCLLIVDVQNDFLPGGSLAVPGGDEIIPVLNRYIQIFRQHELPIVASRDWHPENHCSFQTQGGPWPVHCVAGTEGAGFAAELALPDSAIVVNKASKADKDAYSAFEQTELAGKLRNLGVERLFVGGLATDYCVLNTVLDALKNHFTVMLLTDAIKAVNLEPDDGEKAIERMRAQGVELHKINDLV